MQRRMVSFEIPSELVGEAEMLAVQLRMELTELACRAFTEYLWQVRTTPKGHRFAEPASVSPSAAQQSPYTNFDVDVWTDFPDYE